MDVYEGRTILLWNMTMISKLAIFCNLYLVTWISIATYIYEEYKPKRKRATNVRCVYSRSAYIDKLIILMNHEKSISL